MSTVANYAHIDVDAKGVARISDSRYKVRHLAAEHHFHGWSADELLRQHPDLKPAEVYSALAYFYDHYEEMKAEIEAIELEAAQNRPTNQMTRDELLKRKAALERHE